MSDVIFPDNCQACGKEFISYELIPVKLGEYSFANIRICLGCLVQDKNIYSEYQKSIKLLLEI